MNQNKIILILVILIVLMSIILGIKIYKGKNTNFAENLENVTSEKNVAENNTTRNLEKSLEEDVSEDITEKYADDVSTESTIWGNTYLVKSTSNKNNSMKIKLIATAIIIVLALELFSWYKICFRLEINKILVIIHAIITIVFTILIFKEYCSTNSNVLSIMTSYTKIFSLILIYSYTCMFMSAIIYRAAGFGAWWLLLTIFIPKVGGVIALIVNCIALWALGEYFEKNGSFKLGLIFLNIIFIPILAFEKE